jgi:hypothetical protein
MQPMLAEDLAKVVIAGLDLPVSGIRAIGGPLPVTLEDYLRQWRRWLGIPESMTLRVPLPIVTLAAGLGDRITGGPMGMTLWRMLRRGNTVPASAGAADLGHSPIGLDVAMARQPSHVQDRWHARLYLLAPLLNIALATLWLISAWVGLTTLPATITAMAEDSAMASWPLVAMARGAGIMDAAVALWLLSGRQVRPALAAMGAMVVAYTAVFGLLQPAQWADPLGGLAKNLVILPAIAVAWILADRR